MSKTMLRCETMTPNGKGSFRIRRGPPLIPRLTRSSGAGTIRADTYNESLTALAMCAAIAGVKPEDVE